MTDTQKDELIVYLINLGQRLFRLNVPVDQNLDSKRDEILFEHIVAKIEEAEMRAEKELYEKIESKLYVRHSECSHYVHIDDGICYLCNPGI